MPPCIPRITHPVSEWSPALSIEGALPGARVVVRIDSAAGPVVVDAVAGGGSDVLPLLAGNSLKAGQRLVLQQTEGPESSPWTDTAVSAVVGAPPADHANLPPPAFVSRLFDFSQRIWVGGTVPGAQIDVLEGGTLVATGRAAPEGARLVLSRVMRASRTMHASQAAPAGAAPLGGTPKTVSGRVNALPVAFGQPLPEPVLAGDPPVGCDGAVPVGAIIDGATVTLQRVTEGGAETAEFDAERLWFMLSKPLDPAGGVLEVSQSFTTQSETRPSPPLTLRVAPAAFPPQPRIEPVCAGSNIVAVRELAPGALVKITVAPPGASTVAYRGMVPLTASEAAFEIAPVPVNSEIAVQQERCGLKSLAAWTTAKGHGSVAPADIQAPLFECARVVRVVGAHAGARLRVWSEDPDGRSRIVGERVAAEAQSVQIAVAPYLALGQSVWVEQHACGGAWQASPRQGVIASPDLYPPPISMPPILGSRTVTVSAIPGAYVEVYIAREDGRAERIGAGCVDPASFAVPLLRPLGREPVFATQSLCGGTSRPGPAAQVEPAERIFPLQKAKKWPVVSKEVEWKSGTLIVRHDGTWEFTISVENKDTKGDVDMDLQVSLPSLSPKFGTVISCELSSPGNDVGFLYGRANRGVPSAATHTRKGSFAAFQDPKYWLDVLGTTAKFEWFVARTDYSLPKPKSEKKPSEAAPGK
jgi:hypothetical protein